MFTSLKIRAFILCTIFHTAFINGQGPDCTGQTLGETSPSTAGTTPGPNTVSSCDYEYLRRQRAITLVFPGLGTSYLLRGTSMAIPCCGVVSGWSFAAAAAGDLTAQVWKNTGGNTYEVVGETLISGVTAGSVYTHSLSPQLSVENGYLFGWHSSSMDIVPFNVDGGVTMGVASSAGKTATGASNTWPAGVDGERWHFGVTVSPNSQPGFTGLPTTVTASTTDAVGTAVYTLSPTDANPDDISDLVVSLRPTSSSLFELVGNEVRTNAVLSAGTYEVIAEVVDHCDSTGTATLTVTVTDTGPNITSLPVAAAYQLSEDTEIETLLHDLIVTDLDTPLTDVTCRIDSTTPSSAPFHLKYKPGTSDYGIYFIPNNTKHLYYDTVPTYYLDVVCNDGTTDSSVKLFQVDIVPNEEPVPTIPASIDVIAADTEAGEVFYTVTATDASTHPGGLSDTLIFSMDNCSCPFRMNPDGGIYSVEDLNSHRTSPYVVNITVKDYYKGFGYNTVGPTQMTIHIPDINHPPNITAPTAEYPNIQTVSIKEHTDAEDEGENLVGTIISAFTAQGFDEDGDDITWEMEFNNGQGVVMFDYDATTGEITSNQDLDYETLRSRGLLTTTVEIRAFDGREYSEPRLLNIEVTNDNEKPEFQQDFYAIETTEGTATTETLECPLFDVEDEDSNDVRDYDIDCGSVGHFKIPATRTATCDAIIQKTQEHDLDSPGAASEVVTCTITVTDRGGLTAETTLEITVKEEDDNPPVLNEPSYIYSITNDSTPGYSFGSFSSDDEDFLPEHKRHTYWTDSSEFGVDPNGVFVSKVDWTGVNAPTQRTFTLYAEDEAGHMDSSEVTVYITDIPPTTTTTAATTTLASVYDNIGSFLDDPGNLAWLIPAVLLGALLLGLLGFMCFRCCTTPGACLNSCRGGRCFGKGARGGRGFFGRRTFARRPRPVRVVEKHRPVRVVERPRPVRVVEEPRPVRVIEEPRLPRTAESKPIVKEPVKEPVKDEAPKKKSSFFDLFKSKPKPKAVDEPKQFHLWGQNDYQSQQKWVG